MISDLKVNMKILKNGTLIDGSGNKRKKADILIEGQKIMDIGTFNVVDAQEIDCTNLCIAPGIVDINFQPLQKLLPV